MSRETGGRWAASSDLPRPHQAPIAGCMGPTQRLALRIYRRPRVGHKVHNLLGGMEFTRPNQVWAADITYVPMARGFLYLVAIMDWYSRYVVAWRLSTPWTLISA